MVGHASASSSCGKCSDCVKNPPNPRNLRPMTTSRQSGSAGHPITPPRPATGVCRSLAAAGAAVRSAARVAHQAALRLRLLLILYAARIITKPKALRSLPMYPTCLQPSCCFIIAAGCSTLARRGGDRAVPPVAPVVQLGPHADPLAKDPVDHAAGRPPVRSSTRRSCAIDQRVCSRSGDRHAANLVIGP